ARLRARRAIRHVRDLPAAALLLPLTPLTLTGPALTRSFGHSAHLRQLTSQARLETASIWRSVPFLIILAYGIINLLATAGFSTTTIYGTPLLPLSFLMVEHLSVLTTLLFIVIVIYAGELVWKERSLRLNEIYDALPIPTWVTFASKLLAIGLMSLSVLAVGALCMMAWQLFHGYHHLAPALYAQGLAIEMPRLLLIAVLAVFLQILTNSRFLGYLLFVLYLISSRVLSSLGFDQGLYRYADLPRPPYSELNGYGHFIAPLLWFTLYWSCFALVLFCLSLLLRVRGTESTWPARLKEARARLHGPVLALLLAGLLGFAATGLFIYYNTNVLNRYISADRQKELQASNEKKYRKYMDIPMPRITSIQADVDIFPSERRVAIRGRYRMKNKTARPIDTLHLRINPNVKVRSLGFREHRLVEQDRDLGYSIYRFARPLAPGEEMTLDFALAVENPGFVHHDSDIHIVGNGTFFSQAEYFPGLGYNERGQLIDPNDRRKHHLPPVDRMPKLDDPTARRNNFFSKDADWVTLDTTVSTSAGQTAIAPGYLKREWTAAGRHYFRYQTEAPMPNFYSYLSADYKVRRDSWNGVAIEIYYHEPAYNVERMIDAVKKSLAYYSASFGPYQHRQVRILEFPRYQVFAQSFANTIPFSEQLGFIVDLRDRKAIDYVFYVTAHEVAHQWWGHQVVGGNVQGFQVLSETLAQYSALMVLEKEYGRDKMRRFLKYDLDTYLRGRGADGVEELPLMRVEIQPYIYYNKGGVVMYALRDAIGEAALNGALARYLRAVRFEEPPYTYTRELLRYLEEVTPPDRRPLLADMLENITLFENRATAATCTRQPDGRYAVDLTLEAKKLRADGKGNETPVPLDDWIDVGVFGEKRGKDGGSEETVLYLAKRHFIGAPLGTRTKLRLVVDQLPVWAGIDPYNKLIDRDSDDNRKRVASTGATGKPAYSPPTGSTRGSS
ncbi:MAG: hypothetical protein M3O15_08715, partial [Acidobacteriota bacterium]|nr:hypothetical protein [Acidobacteriota bacterium]